MAKKKITGTQFGVGAVAVGLLGLGAFMLMGGCKKDRTPSYSLFTPSNTPASSIAPSNNVYTLQHQVAGLTAQVADYSNRLSRVGITVSPNPTAEDLETYSAFANSAFASFPSQILLTSVRSNRVVESTSFNIDHRGMIGADTLATVVADLARNVVLSGSSVPADAYERQMASAGVPYTNALSGAATSWDLAAEVASQFAEGKNPAIVTGGDKTLHYYENRARRNLK